MCTHIYGGFPVKWGYGNIRGENNTRRAVAMSSPRREE